MSQHLHQTTNNHHKTRKENHTEAQLRRRYKLQKPQSNPKTKPNRPINPRKKAMMTIPFRTKNYGQKNRNPRLEFPEIVDREWSIHERRNWNPKEISPNCRARSIYQRKKAMMTIPFRKKRQGQKDRNPRKGYPQIVERSEVDRHRRRRFVVRGDLRGEEGREKETEGKRRTLLSRCPSSVVRVLLAVYELFWLRCDDRSAWRLDGNRYALILVRGVNSEPDRARRLQLEPVQSD